MVPFLTAVESIVSSVRLAEGSNDCGDVQAKSSVTPNGVPSSSFREYRFPIVTFESSTLHANPALLNFCAIQPNAHRVS
jgi:hypothetical protein